MNCPAEMSPAIATNLANAIPATADTAPAATHGRASRRSWDYDPGLLGGGSVVPYVGQWSGEQVCVSDKLIRRPAGGIGYSDETLVDRDEWNLLWPRVSTRIGAGRPLFTDLHPHRQRRAMLRLLCQVCAKPADRTPDGTLWLVPGDQVDHDPGWAEGITTIQPPLCRPCALLSVRMCPALRTHYAALRAHSRVVGVTGLVFKPAAPFPCLTVTEYADVVLFSDPIAPWTLATQLARVLFDATVVDLDELA